jgi:hypothetical protein
MTDFVYNIEGDKEEFLDIGQQWVLMEGRPIRVLISELYPYREIVRVHTRKTSTGAYNMTRPIDLQWSTFQELYNNNMAYLHIDGEPIKRLPPHKFL